MNVNFIGHLGKDAEVSETKSGKVFTKFSVAETIYSNGEQSTQWINCVDFRSATAEKLKQYLLKGSQVYITGEAKIAKWEGNDGVERSALECIVQNIKLCGKKSDSSAPAASKKPAADLKFDDDDIAF